MKKIPDKCVKIAVKNIETELNALSNGDLCDWIHHLMHNDKLSSKNLKNYNTCLEVRPCVTHLVFSMNGIETVYYDGFRASIINLKYYEQFKTIIKTLVDEHAKELKQELENYNEVYEMDSVHQYTKSNEGSCTWWLPVSALLLCGTILVFMVTMIEGV